MKHSVAQENGMGLGESGARDCAAGQKVCTPAAACSRHLNRDGWMISPP